MLGYNLNVCICRVFFYHELFDAFIKMSTMQKLSDNEDYSLMNKFENRGSGREGI